MALYVWSGSEVMRFHVILDFSKEVLLLQPRTTLLTYRKCDLSRQTTSSGLDSKVLGACISQQLEPCNQASQL